MTSGRVTPSISLQPSSSGPPKSSAVRSCVLEPGAGGAVVDDARASASGSRGRSRSWTSNAKATERRRPARSQFGRRLASPRWTSASPLPAPVPMTIARRPSPRAMSSCSAVFADGRLDGRRPRLGLRRAAGLRGQGRASASPTPATATGRSLVGVGARPTRASSVQGALRSAPPWPTRGSRRGPASSLDLARPRPTRGRAGLRRRRPARRLPLRGVQVRAHSRPRSRGSPSRSPDAADVGDAGPARRRRADRAEAINLGPRPRQRARRHAHRRRVRRPGQGDGAAHGLKVTVHDEAAIAAHGLRRPARRQPGLGAAAAVRRAHLRAAPGRRSTPRSPSSARASRSTPAACPSRPADGMMTMKDDMGGGAAVLGAIAGAARPRRPGARCGATSRSPTTCSAATRRASATSSPTTASHHRGAQHRRRGPAHPRRRPGLGDGRAQGEPARRHRRPRHADRRVHGGPRPRIAGLIGNDDELADQLLARRRLRRASGSGALPLADADRKGIDSPIADRKNIGGPYGGAITAGLFLRDFVPTACRGPTSTSPAPRSSRPADEPRSPPGGTGFGVRTLLSLLERWPLG